MSMSFVVREAFSRRSIYAPPISIKRIGLLTLRLFNSAPSSARYFSISYESMLSYFLCLRTLSFVLFRWQAVCFPVGHIMITYQLGHYKRWEKRGRCKDSKRSGRGFPCAPFLSQEVE